MQRLNSVNPQVATGRTKELLDKSTSLRYGSNTARVMANSPAVLEAFLSSVLQWAIPKLTNCTTK